MSVEAKRRATELVRLRNLALEEAAEVAIRNGAPALAQKIRQRMDVDIDSLPRCQCDCEFGDTACKAHPGCEACGELYDQHAVDCSKTQFWARKFGAECASPALDRARADAASQEREACIAALGEAIAGEQVIKDAYMDNGRIASREGRRDDVAYWAERSLSVDDRIKALRDAQARIDARKNNRK